MCSDLDMRSWLRNQACFSVVMPIAGYVLASEHDVEELGARVATWIADDVRDVIEARMKGDWRVVHPASSRRREE